MLTVVYNDGSDEHTPGSSVGLIFRSAAMCVCVWGGGGGGGVNTVCARGGGATILFFL